MSKRPVVMVVMDGIGCRESTFGNAVKAAYTPTLDKLWANCPHTQLKAHGLAVGLPSDEDMGNSEVGHNALGCGQVYAQGAKLVNEHMQTGEMFKTKTWKDLVAQARNGHMHLLGLLSDGNVHAHINHVKELMKQAKADGVKELRLHVLLDGRDVPETSALLYIEDIETYMVQLEDENFHACIASGGGRMTITMDRYEANWAMVEKGWHIHVLGDGRMFSSATEAIETYRKETGVIDQDLPGFVIANEGVPVGMIEDGDAVVLFNFRGDRAQEISLAFDQETFDKFDRIRVPNVMYAGMLQYDADLNIPHNFLTYPPKISHTLTEELCKHEIREYAISETQKYGHVTYFWNGNRSGKVNASLEEYVEITSDVIPFEQRPWMKCAEITDNLIAAIKSGNYDFLRVNYPNGDMVGHTGNFAATQIGVESVDLQLTRILKAVDAIQGIVVVTADHGNADEMYEKRKKEDAPLQAKTSHTLNKVPFIVYGADVTLSQEESIGLANVAATISDLLGVDANAHWQPSLIMKK